MRTLLVLLSALGAVGCSLGDCPAESAQATVGGTRLVADGTGLGDTLTVAFVTDSSPALGVTTGAGVGVNPPPAVEGAVEVVFDAEATGLAAVEAVRRLVATPRGDTLFVYVEGTFDASVFERTCSLPAVDLLIDVRAILVPEGTVAARVATVSAAAVSASAAATLQAADDVRRLSRPIHI